MQYNFNMNNKSEDEELDFDLDYKKYNIINKYKPLLFVGISMIVYIIFNFIGINFHLEFFMNMSNIVKVIASCCISGIFLSFTDLYYDAESIYRRILKKIEYNIIIKKIDTFADIYDVNNIHKILPGLCITYDIKKICTDKFGVLFELGDEKYEVVSLIDPNIVSINAEKKIKANELFEAINKVNKECVDKDGYVKFDIVRLKENINVLDVITKDDFYEDVVVSEFLLLPYILEENNKTEDTSIKKDDIEEKEEDEKK